jgi:hypothetical protein
MNNPSFYAIIPAHVRYNKNVCANAKLLYGEITSLCNKEGYCWASNTYFSKLYGVSQKSISGWINSLIQEGFIISKIDKSNGNKRLIFISDVYTKSSIPMEENVNTPMEENVTHNNKTTKNKYKAPPSAKPKGFVYPEEFITVWNTYKHGDKYAAYRAWYKSRG